MRISALVGMVAMTSPLGCGFKPTDLLGTHDDGTGGGGGMGASSSTTAGAGNPMEGTSGSGIPADVTPPTLVSVKFDQESYAAPATGFVTYKATDDNSGIVRPCFDVVSESAITSLGNCYYVSSLGKNTYKASFDIGPFVENGLYYLEAIHLEDSAENGVDYPANLATGFYEGTNIPIAMMAVAGATPDLTPPELLSVEFDQASYTAPGTASVTFKATDNLSGINDYQGCWYVVSESAMTSLSLCGEVLSLGNNTYKASFDIGSSVEDGLYYLESIYLQDAMTNYAEYEANIATGFYKGTNIPVATMTVAP